MLRSGFRAICRRKPSPDSASSAFSRRVIKYDDETEGTWLRKVKVLEDAQSFQPPVIRPGVLSAIADALFIDHKVLLRCRSARSRNTEVIVRPLAIIQKGVRTYLVYQTDAGDFQHIALNRWMRPN